MGYLPKVAIGLHVYIVLPFVVFSLFGVLKMHNLDTTMCACESNDKSSCFFITSLCLDSDLEILSNRAQLNYSQQTIFPMAQSIPVNLTHGVMQNMEQSDDQRTYIPRLFEVYMLLHLAVMFLELWSLQPLYAVSTFAKHIQGISRSSILHAGDKTEAMERIAKHTNMGKEGFRLFAQKLVGLILACIQLVLVSVQVDDFGGQQLMAWMFGSMDSDEFLYTGFPAIVNCRFNGTTCFPGIIPCYLDQPTDAVTTCLLPSSRSNRVLFGFFYVWLCIFTIVLTFVVIMNLLVLLSPGIRKSLFLLWATEGFASAKYVDQRTSGFEFLYLLQLRNDVDMCTFIEFSKPYADKLRNREFGH